MCARTFLDTQAPKQWSDARFRIRRAIVSNLARCFLSASRSRVVCSGIGGLIGGSSGNGSYANTNRFSIHLHCLHIQEDRPHRPCSSLVLWLHLLLVCPLPGRSPGDNFLYPMHPSLPPEVPRSHCTGTHSSFRRRRARMPQPPTWRIRVRSPPRTA